MNNKNKPIEFPEIKMMVQLNTNDIEIDNLFILYNKIHKKIDGEINFRKTTEQEETIDFPDYVLFNKNNEIIAGIEQTFISLSESKHGDPFMMSKLESEGKIEVINKETNKEEELFLYKIYGDPQTSINQRELIVKLNDAIMKKEGKKYIDIPLGLKIDFNHRLITDNEDEILKSISVLTIKLFNLALNETKFSFISFSFELNHIRHFLAVFSSSKNNNVEYHVVLNYDIQKDTPDDSTKVEVSISEKKMSEPVLHSILKSNQTKK